jgi:hypothetical protein
MDNLLMNNVFLSKIVNQFKRYALQKVHIKNIIHYKL